MAIQAEPFQVGQALVVKGTVRGESTNGVTRVIEPNSQIFLDDQIATGSSGSVSIILSDGDGTHLELGRMSQLIVDEDVVGGTLPDLGDVAIETDLATALLQSWDAFEPLAPIDSIVPDSGDILTDDSGAADSIPGLESSSKTIADSDSQDAQDEGASSIDDDLDMTNLIPPPEDSS